MYRVYLVDDEPLALAHCTKAFPWQEHNFEVVGASTKPLDALREIAALAPDVVFTDIHMAAMSGLDLIRHLKEAGSGALFVVVSAYDRFAYARELIRMEGFDYLIKPVEDMQCRDLLTRLQERLDKHAGSARRPATASAELNRILAHLARNFAQKQSLTEIAQLFSISPNYVCRLFSKHLGTTFSAHLSRLRMEHAARLLRVTDKPVKEIAQLSGYDDYFYFCHVFRDTYHCTPTQYRSQS
ncbi:putative response regulatory protein [Clostridia bacterium]|nr:putative response regulatory protein [Clostridia bacterium]